LQCERLEDRLTPVIGGYDILPLVQEPWSMMPGSATDNFAGVVNYAESCTGALVDRGGVVVGGQYVLLAAHCLPAVGDRVTFYLPAAPGGVADGSLKPITISVSDVWVHPLFDPATLRNDIALVTLASLAPYGATAYQLNTATNEVGKDFVMSGYGLTGTGTSGQTAFGGRDYEFQRMTVTATSGRFFVGADGVAGTTALDFDATATEIEAAILDFGLATVVTQIAAGPYAGAFEIAWDIPNSGNQPQLEFFSDVGANALRNGAAAGRVDFVTLHNGEDSEFQRLLVSGSSGIYTLLVDGNQTGPIAYNATAAQIEDALNAQAGYGAFTVFRNAPGDDSIQFNTTGNFDAIEFLPEPSFVGTGSVRTLQDGGARTFRVGTNRYDSAAPATTSLMSDFDENSTDSFEGQGDSGGAGFIDVGGGDYAIASVVSNGGLFFGDPELNTRVSTFVPVLNTVLNPTTYALTLDMTKQLVGGDGLTDTISLQEVGGLLEIRVDGNLYFRDTIASVSSLRIVGSGDSDVFVISGALNLGSITLIGDGGTDYLVVYGSAGDELFGVYSTGAASGALLTPTARYDYSSVEAVSVEGGGGTDSLNWVDASDRAYGTPTAPVSGIVYVPTGAASGDLRIDSSAFGFRFGGIAGTFALYGDSDGSGDRDTLTVLAPSAAGAQSDYGELAVGDGVDAITVTEEGVTISNSSLGALRPVSLGAGTFATLYVRGGNELGPVGDTFTVTPSTAVNIVVDGMGPQRSRPGDILIVNSVGEYSIAAGSPTLGPAHNRYIRLSDRANFGFLGFEAVPSAQIVAVATNPGVGGEIRGLEPGSQAVRWAAKPFGEFAGGMSIAVGDVDGDGLRDVVVGAGPGAGPRVVALSGGDGREILSFFAFAATFAGGVTVASGDVDGDGVDDIIVGADTRGFSHVKVFDGRTLAEIRSFYAFRPDYEFGVRVAAGDVNGDGRADIFVSAGAGGAPQFRIFDGATGALLVDLMAFAPDFAGGLSIAAGDVDGDGRADAIVGAGGSGLPHVKVYSGATGAELASFYVNEDFSPNAIPSVAFEGGISVGASDLDGDGIDEILIGKGAGTRSLLRSFRLAARDRFGSIAFTGLQPFSSKNVFEGFFGGITVTG